MIKRTKTHVIDTLAVREVISSIPEDWLVRGMEERDYGIDLSIEIFEGSMPTGRIALIQVKGTKSSFAPPVKLTFPTKTIEYSLLFNEPFFVFHTSIPDKKTYFVWAQKYAATKLTMDSPNWKSQDWAQIHFPEQNELRANSRKISDIMTMYSARNEGIEYLANYEWFLDHWSAIKNGNEIGLIDACIDNLKRLASHQIFCSVFMSGIEGIDFHEIEYCLSYLKQCIEKREGDAQKINEHVITIDNQIELLDLLKRTFLDSSDLDKFYVEHSDICPF